MGPVRAAAQQWRPDHPTKRDRRAQRGDLAVLDGSKQRSLILAPETLDDVGLARAVQSHGTGNDSRGNRSTSIYARFQDDATRDSFGLRPD